MGTILSTAKRQILRYAAVGLAANLSLYAIYLVLTATIFEPKTAMTVTYACGVLMTYWFNRRWTFAQQGFGGYSLLRYVAAYASGYTINVLALLIFVDHYGIRHEIVQACMTVLLAIMLFLLQKYWVFRTAPENKTAYVEEASPAADRP